MQPAEALERTLLPRNGVISQEKLASIFQTRKKIKANVSAQGERNLEAVKRERARQMPELEVGDVALLGAPKAWKKHGHGSNRYAWTPPAVQRPSSEINAHAEVSVSSSSLRNAKNPVPAK